MRTSDLAEASRIRAWFASGARPHDRRADGLCCPRHARKQAGVTGADVARAMQPQVVPQTVTAWERGNALPRPEHALAYGRVMARLAESGTRRGAQ